MTTDQDKTRLTPAAVKWIAIYLGAWTLFVSAPAFVLGGFEPMMISAIVGGLLGAILALRGVFGRLSGTGGVGRDGIEP